MSGESARAEPTANNTQHAENHRSHKPPEKKRRSDVTGADVTSQQQRCRSGGAERRSFTGQVSTPEERLSAIHVPFMFASAGRRGCAGRSAVAPLRPSAIAGRSEQPPREFCSTVNVPSVLLGNPSGDRQPEACAEVAERAGSRRTNRSNTRSRSAGGMPARYRRR